MKWIKLRFKFNCPCQIYQSHRRYCTTAIPSKNTNEMIRTLLGGTDPTHQQKSSLIGQIEQPPAVGGIGGIGANSIDAIGLGTSSQVRDFPEAPIPELCCGSGCPNCVYIQYAEEVMDYVKSLPLHNGIVEKQKKIVRDAMKKNIQDDNLRMFLLMEIEAKGF